MIKYFSLEETTNFEDNKFDKIMKDAYIYKVV